MAKSAVIQINDKRFSEVIKDCNVFESLVKDTKQFKAIVIDQVPFKIRVQNITVPGYNPSNVPPIGIAIIGVNNYIL